MLIINFRKNDQKNTLKLLYSRLIFLFTFIVILLVITTPTIAGGILPKTLNQVMIYTNVSEEMPTFYLLFSEKPLAKYIKQADIATLLAQKKRKDILALKVYGKKAASPGRFSYYFGTKLDPDKSWNNGKQFHWEDWAKYSPDLWDNIAIAYQPPASTYNKKTVLISHVVIRRGGKILLDTRKKSSYANKKKVSFRLPKKNLHPIGDKYPLLSLSKIMKQFRTLYYELTGDILQTAYSDLGQTDKNKYAKRGRGWCSEFASYVFRHNGINTPNPNKFDVQWKNLRSYFEKYGHVYTFNEVAAWPDHKKIKLIKPGSVACFLTNKGRTTHTAIFTTWIRRKKGKLINSYAAISGNNFGMVWAHSRLSLPSKKWATDKTEKEIINFNNKCFFGVPATQVAAVKKVD